MTKLNQTNFEHNFNFKNKNIKIKFDKFVPNAIEQIVDDENGIPMANIVVSTFSGVKSIDLKDTQLKKTQFLDFALNKQLKDYKRPLVTITTKKMDKFYIKQISLLRGIQLKIKRWNNSSK